MRRLLDTDVASDHLAEVATAVQLLEQLAPSGIAVSIVTYMELYQSVLRASDPVTALAKLDEFLSGVPTIGFSPDIARRCARVREDLMQQGRRVRSRALDLMIAATALEHGLTLVTRNTSDYAGISGLVLH